VPPAEESMAMAVRGKAKAISLRDDGGHLALDFVNTLDWRDRAQPVERLAGWPELLDWLRRVRILGAREAKTLAREARAAPRRAAAHFRAALRLREASSRLFRAWLGHRAADPADLALLNARLRRRPHNRELAASGADYVWRRAREGGAPARLLGVLAEATAELLTSPELRRLRLCKGAGCGWLFLDVSPNRSRRWCAMANCGNRAKARRHYARRREAG